MGELVNGNPFFKYASMEAMNPQELITALSATCNGAVYFNSRYKLIPSDWYYLEEIAKERTYVDSPICKEGELVKFKKKD